ncbi:MAG: hypothetical protein C5S45_01010, partial [Candidatus Methanocomedens sp.]
FFMIVITLSNFNVEAIENENLNRTALLNESSTSLPTELLLVESKFRVSPTVVLRPVNDVIDTTQDGIIELFVLNPSINNVTLNLEATISMPSGIHIYGSGFSSAGGAGNVYGFLSVPPGNSRTMYVNIRGEKIGSYTVNVTGHYWPDENKNALILLSLSHPFMVKETSREEKTSLSPPNVAQFQLINENIWIFVIIGAICSIILVIFGPGGEYRSRKIFGFFKLRNLPKVSSSEKFKPVSQLNRYIEPENYICSLNLAEAIQRIYPDNSFTYPHGEAGKRFSDGKFVSFNGRIGKIIYAHCDFKDMINVPLSSKNRDDLLKFHLIQLKES